MNENINLEETLAAFSAYLIEKGRKQSTIERYAYDIKDFYKWLRANEKFLHIKLWSELPTENYQEYFYELENKSQNMSGFKEITHVFRYS